MVCHQPRGDADLGAPTGWSVLGEAKSNAVANATTYGPQGTSFLLRILPYIEGDTIGKNWNWNAGICNQSNAIAPFAPNCNYTLAITDIKGFYCPTRRSTLRAGIDTPGMFSWSTLSSTWTGGGTDYGGCAGRQAAFNTQNFNYSDPVWGSGGSLNANIPSFIPVLVQGSSSYSVPPNPSNPSTNIQGMAGIFGQTNQSTTFAQIRDGTSVTLLTGELQRVTTFSGYPMNSVDGWAVGGPCTLFTAGMMFKGASASSISQVTSGGLVLCNNFYGSPGSDHANGANMGFADGSVTFINSSVDANIFALLGSMADNQPIAGKF